MKTKYTFWELINTYKIEIPKIQRDYAQGRNEPAINKIASDFLDDLIDSIQNNDELNLDFVYGKIENDLLIPLDGQQRLTTLFLLHWYIALKENRLDGATKQTLVRFTYETRISSHDFCARLVADAIQYNTVTDKISTEITDSKWYFLSWKTDPTVAAMLNMLDLIHTKLKDIDQPLFDNLVNSPNITFSFLPLDKFKLTDELYIKMNARGLPLTEFENFKAKFSVYLTDIREKSKLDNDWLDIFWNMEKNGDTPVSTENVDKRFFNFFKNITLNFYVEQHEIDKNLIDNYDLFDIYTSVYQQQEYVDRIVQILDGLTSYDDSNYVFRKFLSSKLDYADRLHFYSLGFFFTIFGQLIPENQEHYDRWMRVTSNLINNTRIESPKEYENAIRSLQELSKNISDIYSYISISHDTIRYFARLQRDEESLKARLILEDSRWENLFIQLEQHPYFDGQIGFALKYSHNENSGYSQQSFENYSRKLSALFSDPFKENHDFLFQRALLVKGDYLPKVGDGDNYTFCIFEEALRTKLENWRKVFNDSSLSFILKELLDDIDPDNIFGSLSAIIENHTVSDWRKIIIENPEDIVYCLYRQIRMYRDGKIFLLSKSQMNGAHKELFSWDLFRKKYEDSTYPPFTNGIWYWPSTSFDPPCMVLDTYNYYGREYAIDIYHETKHTYKLRFYDRECNKPSAKIQEMLEQLGFDKENRIQLQKNEIEEKIIEICEVLSQLKKG
ncbi:hypothetical protein M2480_002905 [Parabacteroides sp. PFB2-12]|uniref:DUF262 domain-containing protein n=1 Tax=unclassified Parabacteroides TaxID=2649774 RepID=UPI0024731B80|nr:MULTISPECIES: DUF262 domain-containing protein [unclassified Parabacteroides]MDH6343740.1 hypothetical protein [Parabacteroides sp. PM6-13]MDH6391902.1 hypothetical protein [Parabacteroides sp. PFB2-12]